VSAWTVSCDKSYCSEKVVAVGDATLHYWWTRRQNIDHELQHVAFLRDAYRSAYDRISAFTRKCMRREKARCFVGLASAIWAEAQARAELDNDMFDCAAYGNTFGACSRIPGEITGVVNAVSVTASIDCNSK
jgi:hypothetical protein